MSSHSYVNGEYKANYLAKISINDRSFHFADAVYEVVAVHNKNLLFWSDHIIRLKDSLKKLNINFKKDPKVLYFICKELMKKNNLVEGIIYIHISRGIAKRNHNWCKSIEPVIVISCIKKGIFALNPKKISLISDKDIRWASCHIKTVSLLPNVILKQKALEKNAFECVLKDKNNFITEATTSNIWILKNKCLITTPLSSNILAGVTRKKVIEVALSIGIRVAEKKFKEENIYNAESTFITNSSSMILEANRLNNKPLSVDKSGLINNLKLELMKNIKNDC